MDREPRSKIKIYEEAIRKEGIEPAQKLLAGMVIVHEHLLSTFERDRCSAEEMNRRLSLIKHILENYFGGEQLQHSQDKATEYVTNTDFSIDAIREWLKQNKPEDMDTKWF